MTKFANELEQFKGFARPNYTPVPDELFDELLAFLTGAELKVLLYIIRRTFGFKRDADAISLSQMLNGIQKTDGTIQDHGAGLSKPTLLQALRSLQERGIVIASRRRSTEKGDEPTVYTLHFRTDDRGQVLIPPVVKKFDQGGGQRTSPGPWSNFFTTQETGLQETDRQETDGNLSKLRKGSHQVSSQGKAESSQSTTPSLGPLPIVSPANSTVPTRSRRAQKDTTVASSEAMLSQTTRVGSSHFSTVSEAQPAMPPVSHTPRGFSRPADVLAAAPGGSGEPRLVERTTAPIATAEQSEDASPEYIENVIRDLSHELSDSTHIRANVTQALHLWEQSGLSVKAFVEVLYSVRRTTRLQSDVKKPMPYLFKLARVQLGLSPNPQKNRTPAAPEQSSPDTSSRTSLAGRYAHRVHR